MENAQTLLRVVSITAIPLCFTCLATVLAASPRLLRRIHHFVAVLCPSAFQRNPLRGPRIIPSYLYTDGLTPAHVTIPVHKGACTGEQLTRYILPGTKTKINLIPTPAGNFAQFNTVDSETVRMLERELAVAVFTGSSEASATLNFILQVNTHIYNMTNPHLLNLKPSSLSYRNCHCKELLLSLAVSNVLARTDIKRKLGALYPVCFDQHVKILFNKALKIPLSNSSTAVHVRHF